MNSWIEAIQNVGKGDDGTPKPASPARSKEQVEQKNDEIETVEITCCHNEQLTQISVPIKLPFSLLFGFLEGIFHCHRTHSLSCNFLPSPHTLPVCLSVSILIFSLSSNAILILDQDSKEEWVAVKQKSDWEEVKEQVFLP